MECVCECVRGFIKGVRGAAAHVGFCVDLLCAMDSVSKECKMSRIGYSGVVISKGWGRFKQCKAVRGGGHDLSGGVRSDGVGRGSVGGAPRG